MEGNNQYELVPQAKTTIANAKSMEVKSEQVIVEVENKQRGGSFGVEVIKYEKGSEKLLQGAEFTVFVKKAGTPDKYVYVAEGLETNDEGKLQFVEGKSNLIIGESLDNIKIDKDNEEYIIILRETKAPEGYLPIGHDIEIKAVSVRNDDKYELVPQTKTTRVEYTKSVEVQKDKVIVEIEEPVSNGTFGLRLIKYEKDSEKLLPGAEFTVIIRKGVKPVFAATRLVTNSEGKLEFVEDLTDPILGEGLDSIIIDEADQQYTVTIIETKAPEGYIGLSGAITFNVTSIETENGFALQAQSGNTTIENAKLVTVSSGEILVEAENTPKKGEFKLKLIKYIEGTTEELPGAEFDVTITELTESEEGTKENTIYSEEGLVTDSNGELNIDKLPITKVGAKYKVTVKETKAPNGYVGIDEEITFTATSRETEDGLELIANVLKLENARKVEIKPEEILVEVENTPESGNFRLVLVKYIKGTTTPLPGAEFDVKISDGKTNIYEAEHLVTNANGKLVEVEGTTEIKTEGASITSLPIEETGLEYTVTIKESKAPEGFEDIEETITFKARSQATENGLQLVPQEKADLTNAKSLEVKAGEIIVEVENTPVSGKFGLELTKYIAGTDEVLQGAEFSVTVTKDGEEGSIYSATGLVTDENGKLDDSKAEVTPKGASISSLPIEKAGEKYTITITETTPPEGYIGIKDSITIKATSTVTANGLQLVPQEKTELTNAKSVEVKAGEILVEVENTKKSSKFELELYKYAEEIDSEDSDSEKADIKLAGAEFSVTIKAGDTNIYDGERLVTNSEGKLLEVDGITNVLTKGVSITSLPIEKAGETYTVIIEETKAPAGYEQNAKHIEFTVQSKAVGDEYQLEPVDEMYEYNAKSVVVESNKIIVKVEDTSLKGQFALNLIKLVNGTTTGLKDAKFKVTIKAGDEEIYSNENLVTNEIGQLIENPEITGDAVSIRSISIPDEEIIYTITIEETSAPEGYNGISEPIVITAKAVATGEGYILTPIEGTDTIENAKLVDIRPSEVYVEVENTPKSGFFGVDLTKLAEEIMK